MNTLIRIQMLPLLAIALFSACRSAGSEVGTPGVVSAPAWSTDQELGKDLAVLNPVLVAEPSGKRVEFTLENTAKHPLEFVFAISGYDRAGHRLSPEQPHWTSLRLVAGARQKLQIELGSPLVESWRLHVLRTGTAHQ